MQQLEGDVSNPCLRVVRLSGELLEVSSSPVMKQTRLWASQTWSDALPKMIPWYAVAVQIQAKILYCIYYCVFITVCYPLWISIPLAFNELPFKGHPPKLKGTCLWKLRNKVGLLSKSNCRAHQNDRMRELFLADIQLRYSWKHPSLSIGFGSFTWMPATASTETPGWWPCQPWDLGMVGTRQGWEATDSQRRKAMHAPRVWMFVSFVLRPMPKMSSSTFWTRALMCPGRFRFSTCLLMCYCFLRKNFLLLMTWHCLTRIWKNCWIPSCSSATPSNCASTEARPGAKMSSLFGLQLCWVFQAIRWVCPKKTNIPWFVFSVYILLKLNKNCISMLRRFQVNAMEGHIGPTLLHRCLRLLQGLHEADGLDARCWSRFSPTAGPSQLWGLLRQALAGWRVWRFSSTRHSL